MKYIWIIVIGILFFIGELSFNSEVIIIPSIVFYSFYLTVLFGRSIAIIPVFILAFLLDTIYLRSGYPDIIFGICISIPLSRYWFKHGDCADYISQIVPISILTFTYIFILFLFDFLFYGSGSAFTFFYIIFLSTFISAVITPFLILLVDNISKSLDLPLFIKSQIKGEKRNAD
ncbi:MAG: hypothetical protein U9O87_08620 [Verrucomicrobiota bacterium]|nr:hypothetical protein [Verrucomicrobiota bacterium]